MVKDDRSCCSSGPVAWQGQISRKPKSLSYLMEPLKRLPLQTNSGESTVKKTNDPEQEAFWLNLIIEQVLSGINAAEFCRLKNINIRQFQNRRRVALRQEPFWTAMIAEQRTSGLSKFQFCDLRKLPTGQFMHWKQIAAKREGNVGGSGFGRMFTTGPELLGVLDRSRKSLLKYMEEDPKYKLSTTQLETHLDICVAFDVPVEPWEIYELSKTFGLPRTTFYVENRAEIIEALNKESAVNLLKDHAQASMAWEPVSMDGFTVDDNMPHIYDPEDEFWHRCKIYKVKWLGGSDMEESFQKAQARGLPSHALVVERARKSVASMKERLQQFDPEKAKKNKWRLECEEQWLAKLEQMTPEEVGRQETQRGMFHELYLQKKQDAIKTFSSLPSFKKTIFALLRKAENQVREMRDIPLVGEGWISETELLYRVKQLIPDHEAIHHGKPVWLGRQHVDIWIPSLNVAIEYQGLQHFQPLDFFGGQETFEKTVERDLRKKALCADHGVRLVEVRYDVSMSDEELKALLLSAPRDGSMGV